MRATSAAASALGGVRSPSSNRAMSWPSATRRRLTIVRRPGSVTRCAVVDAAALERLAEPAARFVVAHDGDQPDTRAERGEVGREVAGAAGDAVRLRHAHGGHGRLACDPCCAPVQVLVEEHVADDGDRQCLGSLEDRSKPLRGVLTLCADCY